MNWKGLGQHHLRTHNKKQVIPIPHQKTHQKVLFKALKKLSKTKYHQYSQKLSQRNLSKLPLERFFMQLKTLRKSFIKETSMILLKLRDWLIFAVSITFYLTTMNSQDLLLSRILKWVLLSLHKVSLSQLRLYRSRRNISKILLVSSNNKSIKQSKQDSLEATVAQRLKSLFQNHNILTGPVLMCHRPNRHFIVVLLINLVHRLSSIHQL